MVTTRIVLSGNCLPLKGLTWETRDKLRIGRQESMDIVLPDHFVSKVQAEVVPHGDRWVLRDLANSDKTPSYLNGMAIQGADAVLNLHDVLQFGRMKLRVTSLEGKATQEQVARKVEEEGVGQVKEVLDTDVFRR